MTTAGAKVESGSESSEDSSDEELAKKLRSANRCIALLREENEKLKKEMDVMTLSMANANITSPAATIPTNPSPNKNDIDKQRKRRSNKLSAIKKELVAGILKQSTYDYLKGGECNTKTIQGNILKAYVAYREFHNIVPKNDLTFEDMLDEMDTILM
jgi:hypothetical protein